MTTTLTTTQKTNLRLTSITDRKGNPAAIDGIPTWSSSDESVLTVQAAEDGMSAVATAVGITGSANVKISVDADLGEGVLNLEHLEFFSVIHAPASTINVEIDAPEETEGPTG